MQRLAGNDIGLPVPKPPGGEGAESSAAGNNPRAACKSRFRRPAARERQGRIVRWVHARR